MTISEYLIKEALSSKPFTRAALGAESRVSTRPNLINRIKSTSAPEIHNTPSNPKSTSDGGNGFGAGPGGGWGGADGEGWKGGGGDSIPVPTLWPKWVGAALGGITGAAMGAESHKYYDNPKGEKKNLLKDILIGALGGSIGGGLLGLGGRALGGKLGSNVNIMDTINLKGPGQDLGNIVGSLAGSRIGGLVANLSSGKTLKEDTDV